MTLTTEFELFDTVYFLHESDIVKGNIRLIKFPEQNKWNIHYTNDMIQYGVLTQKKLDSQKTDPIPETTSEYEYRFASQLGKTKNELLDKLKDK